MKVDSFGKSFALAVALVFFTLFVYGAGYVGAQIGYGVSVLVENWIALVVCGIITTGGACLAFLTEEDL